MAEKYASRTSRSRSGSSCSPSVVDPVTSANTTVTSLRSVPGAAAGSTGSPQAGQNRAASGRGAPQRRHTAARGEPQEAQKRLSAGLDAPQTSQVFILGV
jgi:hypothetical protein